jgi:hypothetical protein
MAKAALYIAAVAAPLCAGDPPGRFDVVAAKPATASFIIGTITMTIPPFVRRNTVYSSTYAAKIFPYFFYNEKGRIWIEIPDDDLRRVALGQPVDFKGHAISDSGDGRRIEGRATPTGPLTGRLRVKVFITRRIGLTYNTTYELQGTERPAANATSRQAR